MSLNSTPATTEPELTDELAEVLAAVLNGTIDASPSDNPGDLTAVEIRRVERKREAQAAALSVLKSLGYVHPVHGGWTVEPAGCQALTAREAAKQAAARNALIASYAAVVAELHAMADAIDAVPVDGLAELRIELQIGTTLYKRNPEADAVNVTTVDAVATAVLGMAGTTEQLGTTDSWQHKAEGRRGSVDAIGRGAIKVDVSSFITDPRAREREAAEQARESEVERLRAELAEAKAALAENRPTVDDDVPTDRVLDTVLDLVDMQRTGLTGRTEIRPPRDDESDGAYLAYLATTRTTPEGA